MLKDVDISKKSDFLRYPQGSTQKIQKFEMSTSIMSLL